MFKNWLKLIFHFFLAFILCCCLIWNQLILYGLSQAAGQLSLILNAQPFAEIIADAAQPDSLKKQLLFVREIKKYTVDSLGLNDNKNYTTFYDQHQKTVLYVVTACERFSFKPKEWTFPFLGTVSYKGFFNKEKAKKELAALREKNYDVDVYSPSGWSTLGWFIDPIQSNMLKRSTGSLVNLLIHELSHGTLYVKNDVTFNENLANFIGDKGTEQFLNYKFGPDSKEAINYEEKKQDEKLFSTYILSSTTRLDSLYKSFSDNSTDQKKIKKTHLITEIVLGINRLPLHNRTNYFKYTLQAFQEGNAFFMAFTRYDSQYDLFEKEYTEKFHSNLRNYILYLKKTYPSL